MTLAAVVAAGKEHNFDFQTWAGRHSPVHNQARVEGVVNALKTEGVTRVATTGYCYGGRLVFNLGIANVADVSATSHPSALQIDDFEVRPMPDL